MIGSKELADQVVKDYGLQSELFDCNLCLYYILEEIRVPDQLARKFHISDSRCVNELKLLFFNLKPTNVPWKYFLYSLTNYKRCKDCHIIKTTEEFNFYKNNFYSYCRSCEQKQDKVRRDNDLNYNEKARIAYKENPNPYKANSAKRRALLKSAVPKWADLDAIKLFYKNCPEGYEVDHIIPLQGKNVCGLHILENLQYLTFKDNRAKYNKF